MPDRMDGYQICEKKELYNDDDCRKISRSVKTDNDDRTIAPCDVSGAKKWKRQDNDHLRTVAGIAGYGEKYRCIQVRTGLY